MACLGQSQRSSCRKSKDSIKLLHVLSRARHFASSNTRWRKIPTRCSSRSSRTTPINLSSASDKSSVAHRAKLRANTETASLSPKFASNAVMRNGLSSVPGRAQGATVLPQHGAEAEKSGSTRSTRFHEGFEDGREPGRYAISIDRKDTGMQWMMMCLTRHDGLADLHHLDFDTRPANNPQFFARLKREYEAKRSQPFPRLGWLSPLRQKVTKVHFVQFQTTFPRLKAGVQIVEVIANPSLPSEDEQGWTCTLRRGTSRAPLPAETMAIGLYGDNSAYEDADVYDWVPRKVHEALPAEPDLDAWGLYFVDEVSWKVMSTIVCVLLLWPLTIGIRAAISWALDKFFGFAVSGNMLMVAQLLVAIMAVSSCKLPR